MQKGTAERRSLTEELARRRRSVELPLRRRLPLELPRGFRPLLPFSLPPMRSCRGKKASFLLRRLSLQFRFRSLLFRSVSHVDCFRLCRNVFRFRFLLIYK